MRDDDPAHAEEIVQRRLAQLGGYKIGGPQYGLRGLLLILAIAPCLIWLLYLAWPTVIHALTPSPAPVAAKMTPHERVEAERKYRRETPLIVGSFVPVVIACVASAVAAFVLVRSLGQQAKYGVLAAISLCGLAVIVAMTLWVAGQGGLKTIASADRSDVFAVYALPVGLAVLAGALTGWRVAEIE